MQAWGQFASTSIYILKANCVNGSFLLQNDHLQMHVGSFFHTTKRANSARLSTTLISREELNYSPTWRLGV